MAKTIDTVLSTAEPTSTDLSGSALLKTGADHDNNCIIVQCIRVPSTGSYEVHLECGVALGDPDDIVWGEIGTFSQDDNTKPSLFNVAMMARYRVRHVSGVNVRVLVAG